MPAPKGELVTVVARLAAPPALVNTALPDGHVVMFILVVAAVMGMALLTSKGPTPPADVVDPTTEARHHGKRRPSAAPMSHGMRVAADRAVPTRTPAE